MTKITKAVIPAAGLGTRMLPIARAVPKEMLPIVDRPAISYLVEEAAASGITDILIITGRDKEIIENYFDYSPEYEYALNKKNAASDDSIITGMRKISDLANIYFIRQKEPRGLGHAIAKARAFTGGDPFMVLYGDDVIFSDKPVCLQLIEAYEAYGLASAAIKEVDYELVLKYCSLDAQLIRDNIYSVRTMIEKPRPDQVITNFSILGRVLLTPDIYGILDIIPPGANGELQLTDAMKLLSEQKGMTAVDFEGTRYDIGSKEGFLRANVERALRHPELGGAFAAYLKELVESL